MPYKVKVDRSLCIGAASCVAIAPDIFELDNEGKSTVKTKDGKMVADAFVNYADTNGTETDIMNAAKSCPVNAIVIVEVDDAGNEIRKVWPQ